VSIAERNRRIIEAIERSVARAEVDPAYARERLRAIGILDENDEWTDFGIKVWEQMQERTTP
jgi:hypothetical protein